MAPLKNPLFSLTASGRLSRAFTLARRLTGPGWLLRGRPADPKTEPQFLWRTMWQLAATLWHQLSPAEQAAWESDGTARGMTGYARYMSQALRPNPGIYLPLAGGTMSGDIDTDGHRVTGLVDPTQDHHAARKGYVDAEIATHDIAKAVRVRRSAHQSIASGGPYKLVNFDTEDFDTDGMWDIGDPGKITIRTAGIYLITAQTGWAAAAGGYRAQYINHSGIGGVANVTTGMTAPGNLWRGEVSTLHRCTVGHFFGLYVFQNSGGPLDLQASGSQYPVLSAIRLGA